MPATVADGLRCFRCCLPQGGRSQLVQGVSQQIPGDHGWDRHENELRRRVGGVEGDVRGEVKVVDDLAADHLVMLRVVVSARALTTGLATEVTLSPGVTDRWRNSG